MEKITVLSIWYNEELLAPLFCNHYNTETEVHILLETDTNDGTRDILKRYPNVVVQDVHCKDGMDNKQMIDIINDAILKIDDGWIYLVDADEFIFPEFWEDPQTFLARQTADIVNATYFHVYRHVTDTDIDYTKPPVPQRLHAKEGKEYLDQFTKPSVFKASSKVHITIGNHNFSGEHSISQERYIGAHWKQADLELCVKRRLSNGLRHSAADRKKGYGNHDYHQTRERLEQVLQKNSNLGELKYFTARR
jgi:hypothetical protein